MSRWPLSTGADRPWNYVIIRRGSTAMTFSGGPFASINGGSTAYTPIKDYHKILSEHDKRISKLEEKQK